MAIFTDCIYLWKAHPAALQRKACGQEEVRTDVLGNCGLGRQLQGLSNKRQRVSTDPFRPGP